MVTTRDKLFNRAPSANRDNQRIDALFGPRIDAEEVPTTISGQAFLEFLRNEGLANDIGGLFPNQSLDIFEDALDGDVGTVARNFGLDRRDVFNAAANQVSPFTALQREAQAENVALGRRPLDSAYFNATREAQNQIRDPFSLQQNIAGDIFENLGTGSLSQDEQAGGQAFRGALQGDAFQGQAQTAADTLGQTAAGGFVGSNPFLDQTFDQAAGRVTDQFNKNILPGIESRFAASGRYGSDAMQRQELDAADLVGENIGDLATNIYGGAYNQERGLQQNAAQSLGSLFGSGTGRQLQAAGGLTGLGGQAQGRALAAGGQLADIGAFGQDQQLQAATLAPALQDTRFQAQINSNNLVAGVGDQQQQLLNQLLGRTNQFYDVNVNSDFDDLERLTGINSALGLTGAAGNGGVGQLQQNRAATGVGGALSGAALGAQIGSVVPGIGTGIGALGGGILGGLGGLL